MEYIIISVLVGLVIFIIFREIFCWYLKINERISLQNKTNELLEELVKHHKSHISTNNKENKIFNTQNESIEGKLVNSKTLSNDELTEALNKNNLTLNDVLIEAKKMKLNGINLTPANQQIVVYKFGLKNIIDLEKQINDISIN